MKARKIEVFTKPSALGLSGALQTKQVRLLGLWPLSLLGKADLVRLLI